MPFLSVVLVMLYLCTMALYIRTYYKELYCTRILYVRGSTIFLVREFVGHSILNRIRARIVEV